MTRSNGRRTVVISYDDYRSNEASLHLMSSQENIRVIDNAIAELDAGERIEVAISY